MRVLLVEEVVKVERMSHMWIEWQRRSRATNSGCHGSPI